MILKEVTEMNLDFSKCKTKEDVKKVFEERKEELEVLGKLREVVAKSHQTQEG